MEPSTSLGFEKYIEGILQEFTDEQNLPSLVINDGTQFSLIESLKLTHRHELFIELKEFITRYHRSNNNERGDLENNNDREIDELIDCKAMHINIDRTYDNSIDINLRSNIDELMVSDIVFICESVDDRKRGTYIETCGSKQISWFGIVRGNMSDKECNNLKKFNVKILGGNAPEFDDTIHYIFKINNLTTTFRQWKTLENYTNLRIMDAKPVNYEKLKKKKDYQIYTTKAYERCNSSQKKCFDVVGTNFKMTKPLIHMINGPPGTGKTTTCIGLVLNLLEGETKSKILYTTTCNSTVEKLMVDIYSEPMFHKHVPIVIGHRSRVGEKVQKYTLGAYVDRLSQIMKNVNLIIRKGKILKKKDEYVKLINNTIKLVNEFPINLTSKFDSKIPLDFINICNDIKTAKRLYNSNLKDTLYILKNCLNQSDIVHEDKMKRIMKFSKTLALKSSLKIGYSNSDSFENVMQIAEIRLMDIMTLWWNRMDRKITENIIKQHCRLLLCTTSVAGSDILKNMKIERVFIEEAAQTILVDSIIPLTKYTKHLVLVGDPKQLKGMVTSNESRRYGYDMSLMHFLENKHEKHNKILLRTQYRMHPDISVFPNNQFYNGELENAQSVIDRDSLVGIGLPTYKVINLVNTNETMHPKVRSYCNRDEVIWIHKLLLLIRDKNPDFDFSRVTIITPYSGQVLLFQEMLRDFNNQITISSIDGIQGKENDVIITSLVRVGDSIGFNNDKNRINVLLTRAKLCMFIVGNMSTFRVDPMWERLIKNAKDRRVYDTQKMIK